MTTEAPTYHYLASIDYYGGALDAWLFTMHDLDDGDVDTIPAVTKKALIAYAKNQHGLDPDGWAREEAGMYRHASPAPALDPSAAFDFSAVGSAPSTYLLSVRGYPDHRGFVLKRGAKDWVAALGEDVTPGQLRDGEVDGAPAGWGTTRADAARAAWHTLIEAAQEA